MKERDLHKIVNSLKLECEKINSNAILDPKIKIEIIDNVSKIIDGTNEIIELESHKEAIRNQIIEPVKSQIRHARFLSYLAILFGVFNVIMAIYNLYNVSLVTPKKIEAAKTYMGTFPVSVGVFENKQGKKGVKNEAGAILIQPVFDNVKPFKQYYFVEKYTKWGVLSKSGKVIIEPKYDMIGGVTDSLFSIKINGMSGIIDLEENYKVPPIYSKLIRAGDNLSIFKTWDRCGLITNTNEIIFQTSKVGEIGHYKNGYYVGRIDGKISILKKPDDVILKTSYDGISNLVVEGDHLIEFCALKNGKYGLIDRNSKVIIEFIYDRQFFFNSKGYAKVYRRNKYLYIDRNGNEVKITDDNIR